MTGRPIALLLLGAVLLSAGFCDNLYAQNAAGNADLGEAFFTGETASNTIKDRQKRVRLAMACGNEMTFAKNLALTSQYGKNGYAVDTNSSQWPLSLMVGKAARLLDSSREGGACEAMLGDNVVKDWAPLTRSHAAGDHESPASVVNRVYSQLYDTIEGVTGQVCANVASDGEHGVVSLRITDECLARQIRAVMTNPGHGPWAVVWENDGNPPTGWSRVVPEFPGTSAEKLPCLSEFGLPGSLKGVVSGDWDMGVIEYTRLTSLLYRFQRSTQPIRQDIDATIAVLNRRFLTLRSSPEQGATAREVFNVVASCGNLGNQFGDAVDTLHGSSDDPGYDNYSKQSRDAVGKKSLWDGLKRLFAALVALVVIAAAALVVGVLAGLTVYVLGGAVPIALAVVLAVGAVGFIGFSFGGFEETENHLLMQNSSRYLKNKLMMAELSAQGDRKGFDTIADLNEDLRTWLLERLQRIAREDFVEYNAKPYNRLSHASILNLLDYACDVSWDFELSKVILNPDKGCDDKDRAIVTAAAAVMDLSAAKDAVGSLDGRRFVPYRRLAAQNSLFYNGKSILDLSGGADNQLAALQVWTGQMKHTADGKAAPESLGDLEWYATSQYRPDPMILDFAVNKSMPREQQYRHYTRERYVSGDGWLITAGGTDERPAQGYRTGLGFTLYLEINKDVTNDRGVGVPTMLMTTAQIFGPDGQLHGRAKVQEFLRFEGNKKDWGKNGDNPLWSFSDNNCVAGSFACGLTLRLPSDFTQDCRTKDITPDFFIVDSTKCASFDDDDKSSDKDIFIAIYQSPKDWGFFEVAQQDAYDHSIDAFAQAITAKNKSRYLSWVRAKSKDTVEYFSVTQNTLLKFTPKDEDFGADRRACGVVNHESGARFTISNVPAAQAAACSSVGPRIYIDLNDAKNPVRSGQGGLALEQFGR